ncbi:hypothetical protein V6N13_030536 [Hibiscus sabdariffa]
MHRLASPSPGHAQSVGVLVTPGWPTTRGFGLVDARSRWLCATCLDNVTPNTCSPCVATVQLGGVSRPSNVRASARSMSQWVCSLLGFFIVPSGCGVPSLIVSSAPRLNFSLVWVVDRWVWMLLLVHNGHVSGEMVVCVGRLRASCIELSSRTPLQCPPLVAVVPKGCDRDPVLLVLGVRSVSIGMIRPRRCIDARSCFGCGSALRSKRDGRRGGMLPVKKLVVGPRGGSAGPPHGEHRSARPYCRRCAPGLNWPGRSSGADSDPIVLAFGIGIIAIVGLQRGIPSKRESSARVDYVPALCTHCPSLLPIEWSGEVFGSRRRGRTTRERVIKHQREGVWSLRCAPSPPCPGDTGTRVPVAKRTTPGVNYAKESE